MNADEIMNEMKLIAEEQGYELTENAEKIAKFRARTGLPMSQCPCDPKASGRGCIGPVCRDELETKKICHCNCFRSCK